MTETLLWYMLNNKLIVDILATEGSTLQGGSQNKGQGIPTENRTETNAKGKPYWN